MAAALLLGACVPEEGPLMDPGSDCMRCHGSGGGEDEARPWTVAGTVYPTATSAAGDGVLGARVHVRDASGFAFTLRTNLAGNFYSAESVALPLEVCVEHGGAEKCMPIPAPQGSCNACHRQPPRNGAPGRLHVP